MFPRGSSSKFRGRGGEAPRSGINNTRDCSRLSRFTIDFQIKGRLATLLDIRKQLKFPDFRAFSVRRSSARLSPLLIVGLEEVALCL